MAVEFHEENNVTKQQHEVEGVGGQGQHTQGVPSLQHEALDHSVEDDAIVVACPGVSGPVLYSLGALIRKKLDMYIASGAVNDGTAG